MMRSVRRARAHAAAWVFPVAIVLVSLLYFGGEIGKHADDWSINLRDPVTGLAPTNLSAYFGSYQYFWRPLHLWMLFGVGTHLFDDVRPVGLFCIAMHLVAGWQLYRLIRLGTHCWPPAAIATMIFVLAPHHYEVSYWFSSISTAIGSATFLYALRWGSERLADARANGRPPGVRFFAGAFTLAFLTPCFYEQPSAMTGAAPFIAAAVLLSRGERFRHLVDPRAKSCRRVLAFTLALGLASVLYVALMVATAPRGARGGDSSFVSSARLSARLNEVLGGAEFCLWGERARQVVLGAWEIGTRELESGVGLSVFVAVAALALGWCVVVVVAPISGGHSPSSSGAAIPAHGTHTAHSTLISRACWIGAGFTVFILGFAPIAMLDRQNVEMRNVYVPLIGAAIVLAQLLDMCWCLCARWPSVQRGVRGVLALASVSLLLACAVCQVGLQDALRKLWLSDVRAIEELARAVPQPPPTAVFVPVTDPRRPVGSRQPLFDILRPSSFAAVWAATAMLQDQYKRTDVSAVRCSPWAPSPFDDAGPLGLRWRSIPRLDDASWVEWERIVPFMFDAKGRVRLIDTLAVERWSGTVYEHVSPLTKAHGPEDGASAGSAGDDAQGPPRVARHRLVLSPDLKSARFAGPWYWVSSPPSTAAALSSGPVAFAPANLRNVLQPVQWMYVTQAGADGVLHPRGAMRTELPELGVGSGNGGLGSGGLGAGGVRLVFRALIQWGPNDQPVPHLRATLVVIDEDGGRELGSLTLSAENRVSAMRWGTLVVPLASHSPHTDGASSALPRRVRVELRPDPTFPASRALTVWVTPGQIVEGLADEERPKEQPANAGAASGPESVRLGP